MWKVFSKPSGKQVFSLPGGTRNLNLFRSFPVPGRIQSHLVKIQGHQVPQAAVMVVNTSSVKVKNFHSGIPDPVMDYGQGYRRMTVDQCPAMEDLIGCILIPCE
jgi:hypothetical protein